MSETKAMSNVRVMVECALMIAIGTLLAQIKLFTLPNEGSITMFSMLPFIMVSFRHGVRWGIMTGFANSILQMLLGGVPAVPAGTLSSLALMILLDYVLAFTLLGLAGLFARPFKNRIAGIVVGTLAACVMRFLCAFFSGVVIWGVYAPEGMAPALYSFTYNASYMIPETVITIVAALAVYKIMPKFFAEAS